MTAGIPADIPADKRVESASSKIRTFEGETPLQVMARQGDAEQTSMTSLERFGYYTAFQFAWYPIVLGETLRVGEVRPNPALADADGPILQFRKWAAKFYAPGDPVAQGRNPP